MEARSVTAACLCGQFDAIRRQHAQWIILTNDLEGHAQREARARADQIKADIVSAEGLVKTGHVVEAYRFLVRRR